MSSQKGNTKRSRQQKHHNATAFKHDLHNKSKKTSSLNSLELAGLCQRCKEKIEWKIKYGKYKPLTVPKKCIKCDEKTVKRAYYNICFPCGQSSDVCCKCGEAKEIIMQPGPSEAEQAAADSRLTQELKCLKERERRSFFRLQEKGQLTSSSGAPSHDSDHDASDGTTNSENESEAEVEDHQLIHDDLNTLTSSGNEQSQNRTDSHLCT